MDSGRENTGRRKLPRRKLGRNVGVLHRGEYLIAEAIEVGEGGMGFRTNTEYPESARVVVSFQVPGAQFVSVIGDLTLGRAEYADDKDADKAPDKSAVDKKKPKDKNKEDAKSASSNTPTSWIYGVVFTAIKFDERRLIRNFVTGRRS